MKKYLILFIFNLLCTFLVQAQTEEVESEKPIRINADSLYFVARDTAHNGFYKDARIICDTILNEYPLYYDVRFLKAQTYTWEVFNDSSLAVIDTLLKQNDTLFDPLSLKATIFYWQEKYDSAKVLCDSLIARDTMNLGLHKLRIRILIAQQDYEGAKEALADSQEKFPDEADFKAISKQLRDLTNKHHIAVYCGYDYFTNAIGNRVSSTLEYKNWNNDSPFLFRVNWANRFAFNDIQIEADYYPRLSKKLLLFLNGGWSTANLFPIFKFGIEPYFYPVSFLELTLGYRHLSFRTFTASIITASTAVYVGDFYLGVRGFFMPYTFGNSGSGELFGRRFFGMKDNFLEVRVGIGNAPADSYLESNFLDFARNQSRYGILTFQHTLKGTTLFKAWTIFDRQIPPTPLPAFSVISFYLGIIWKF